MREVRQGAIENEAQEAHVERCRPLGPAPPPRTADSIRDRALGAFLGLAVGDAVGTTLEFCPRDTKPRLEDMIGGGPFGLPPGGWTDDTSMALALADSLAARGTLDCRDLMDRFVRWWRHGDYSHTGECCFDIGNTTRRCAEDRYLQKPAIRSPGSTDPRSAGNGSLMRLAPVALRFRHEPAAPERRPLPSNPARPTGPRRPWTLAGRSRSCSPMPSPGHRAPTFSPRGRSREPRPSPES